VNSVAHERIIAPSAAYATGGFSHSSNFSMVVAFPK
jgi:hypothetical protein